MKNFDLVAPGYGQEPKPTRSLFWRELMGGLTGSAVGAVVVGIAVVLSCQWFGWPGGSECGFGVLLGIPVGIPIGAAAGVIIVGYLAKAKGSVLLAIIGALAGPLLFYMLILLARSVFIPDMLQISAGSYLVAGFLLPSILSAVGYNILNWLAS